jgi:apolipoprotein N-acyltransferase
VGAPIAEDGAAAALISRLRGTRPTRRWALAALAGAALTLAQPPVSLWQTVFLSWPTLAILVAATPGRRAAAAVGFWAGFGFFLTGLYWVGEAFLVEAAKVWWYAPLMPLAIAALAAACAAFWAGGFALARTVWRRGWRGAVALGSAMTLAEIARGAALTGFPWALQAYAWIETPVYQTAALIGPFALTGVTIALAALPAWTGRREVRPLLAPLLAVALAWGGGAWRVGASGQGEAASEGPLIRLVQPNTRQVDKWAPENRRPIFETLLALSAAPSDAPIALTVWPEVAVTFLFDETQAAVDRAAATTGPAALAVGAVRRDDRGGLRNSLLFYGADGAPRGVYDKVHLTPFGEYVPYAWILSRIGLGTLGDGLSGFTPGEAAALFSAPGLPPAAPLICYETIFPGAVRRASESAGFLLQVTNDAWFGDSAGPWQHLAQARARAVELGLPVARAANTGVSAMIDGHGRIVASLALGAQGALDSPLPPALAPTLVRRFGEAPALALWAIVATASLARGVRARPES